jgi:hypothetical protein
MEFKYGVTRTELAKQMKVPLSELFLNPERTNGKTTIVNTARHVLQIKSGEEVK